MALRKSLYLWQSNCPESGICKNIYHLNTHILGKGVYFKLSKESICYEKDIRDYFTYVNANCKCSKIQK